MDETEWELKPVTRTMEGVVELVRGVQGGRYVVAYAQKRKKHSISELVTLADSGSEFGKFWRSRRD